jgi:hypothetical protein
MEYRRQVAMRCDGEDFVIALQPEDEIVFRTKDARALRNLCRRLRWQIAIDTTLTLDGWTWPPETAAAARQKIWTVRSEKLTIGWPTRSSRGLIAWRALSRDFASHERVRKVAATRCPNIASNAQYPRSRLKSYDRFGGYVAWQHCGAIRCCNSFMLLIVHL